MLRYLPLFVLSVERDFESGRFAFNPVGKLGNFRVREKFLSRIVIVFQLFIRQMLVNIVVTRSADIEYPSHHFVSGEVLLVFFVVVTALGNEMVFGKTAHLSQTEFAFFRGIFHNCYPDGHHKFAITNAVRPNRILLRRSILFNSRPICQRTESLVAVGSSVEFHRKGDPSLPPLWLLI